MDEAATGQTDSAKDRSPHVRLRGIAKHFGGVQALRGIDLDIERGSIHGLVGENGAGKSTLGKIITGVYRPDGGVLEVGGREVDYHSPREALEDGLALIAQELSLVPKLTVMENVLLGTESKRLGMLNKRAMRARFRELDRLGLELPADTPVGALRPADQQKVEVMRAVARDVDLIVMDEPTTSLTPDERDRLFGIARAQAAAGTTIIFVSHALEGVLALCDSVTVLRDGQLVRSAPAANETPQSLVTAMIGRSLEAAFPDRTPLAPDAPVVLRAEKLGAGGRISDVSFEVRAGEIVGFSGLIGSGRSEVARALFGADSLDVGTVELDGAVVRLSSPRKAVKHGVVMLPESRKEQGLVLGASIADNVSLPHLERFNTGGVVRRPREAREVAELCDRVGVKAGALSAPVASLSGGNQQKVMFAKWLVRPPKVLIADEPTRGVDVGAKRQIYELITTLAADGMAVILISSELEEVLGLAHRIVVMRAGRVAGELEGVGATEEEVLRLAFGTEPLAEGAA